MTDYFKEMTAPAETQGEPVAKGADYYSEIMSEQNVLHSHPENTPSGQFSPGTLPQHKIDPLSAEQEAKKLPIETADDVSTIEAVKQGFVDNPESKMKRYAEQRFPNDPNALDKYGIVDGNIVYYDEAEGVLKAEQGTLENVVEGVTRMTPATVGGIGLGVATGNPAGAGLGAAGGEAWRKNIGATLGDEQTVTGNLSDIAIEGVLNAAGWKLGTIGGNKIIDRRVARDIDNFDKEATNKIIETAKEHGVDLTPAEASELGSLISQQTRLGMSFDEAGDTIRKFYQKRAGQVDKAVDDFIGDVPPSSVAGGNARNTAAQVIEDAKKIRSEQASPLYKEAFDSNQNISDPLLDRLLNTPAGKQAMQDASKKMQNDMSLMGAVDGELTDQVRFLQELGQMEKITAEGMKDIGVADGFKLRTWDYIKRSLDDQIETAKRAGEKDNTRILTNLKNKLVNKLDDLDITAKAGENSYKVDGGAYKRAREAYAGKSPEIDDLEKGIIGVLANVKDPALVKSADKIFNAQNIDPHDVMKLHTQFRKAGHQKDWDNFLNSFLRKQWESIKPTQSGTDFSSGAKFKQSVFGSKRQQELMEAAMGSKRYKSFKDLMDVLEATGRVPKGQSMTEPAQQAARQEAIDAAPIANYAKELDITKPASWFNLENWWINAKKQGWQNQIAKVITNPDSIRELEKLRKLKTLSPGQQNAISIVSTAIVRGLGLKAKDSLKDSTERTPPILNQSKSLEAL